jgi:hypothetical protein
MLRQAIYAGRGAQALPLLTHPALQPFLCQKLPLHSVCFFIVDGEARVVVNQDGSQMGCVLGSFGFDLVVQDIYETAQAGQPTTAVRALMDDLNNAVPPQHALQKQLALCSELHATVRDEAKRVAGLADKMNKMR